MLVFPQLDIELNCRICFWASRCYCWWAAPSWRKSWWPGRMTCLGVNEFWERTIWEAAFFATPGEGLQLLYHLQLQLQSSVGTAKPTPERMSDRMPGKMSESESMPDRMSDKMSKYIPERCSDKMPDEYAAYTSRWYVRTMSEYCFRVGVAVRSKTVCFYQDQKKEVVKTAAGKWVLCVCLPIMM